MDIFELTLGAYKEIEIEKARANASGVAHTKDKLTTERPSGSAVALDNKPTQPAPAPKAPAADNENFVVAGVKVNKKLILGSVGLLGFGLVAKKLKLI